MKKHSLNHDEVTNIVNNFGQLPFKLEDKDFNRCKEQLEKYEDLKEKTEKLMSSE
jgi:hypothetical protein